MFPLILTVRVCCPSAPVWHAVGRFMRFGVTSVTGLIAGLLAPFGGFLRTPQLTAIGGALVLSILAFLYFTLQAMQTSGPELTPPARPNGASLQQSEQSLRDPSMTRLLEDIYGDDM